MRQYSRSFITLKQERSEYSNNNRQALGRCIIESKENTGKISVYVQGLKPQILYKLYIICTQSSQSIGVPIGTINVDDRGKCESKWEFDADNVGGSGIAIEDFNVIAVTVSQKNDFDAILVGFTSSAVMWKNNFIEHSEMKVQKEDAIKDTSVVDDTPAIQDTSVVQETHVADEIHVIQNTPAVEEVPVIQNTPVVEEVPVIQNTPVFEDTSVIQNTDKTDELEKDNNDCEDSMNKFHLPADDTLEAAHLAFREIINKFNSEMEILQNFKLDESVGLEATVEMENLSEESIDLERSDSKASNGLEGNELESSGLEGNEPKPADLEGNGLESTGVTPVDLEIDSLESLYVNKNITLPFAGRFNDTTWIRISIKELARLNYVQYMNMPFVVSGYRKFKHLLLGKNEHSGEKKYIIGVPERFSMTDEHYAKQLGFRFECADSAEIYEGCFGYWLY